MEKCEICTMPVETAIFKNSGVCSEVCAKVQRKEISKRDAKALRVSQIIKK